MAAATKTNEERLGELVLIDLRRRRAMHSAAERLRQLGVDEVAERLEAAAAFGRAEPAPLTPADIAALARHGIDCG